MIRLAVILALLFSVLGPRFSAADDITLDQLQLRLVKAARDERETATRLRETQQRIVQLEKEQGQVAGALKAQRQTLAELLVALARLSRLPPEIGLLRQDRTRDALLTSILLNSSLPEVRKGAEALAASLHDLDRVQAELEKQRTELAAARQVQERERAGIEDLIARRRAQTRLSDTEEAALAARQATLRDAAKDSAELIEKVASSGAVDKTAKAPPPVLALRGGFLQPVSGELARGYGARDDAGVESKGLTFRAEGNERLVAPARGRVMFAGPFKGYGHIVIIEHDGDMHSLLGGFGRIDVSVGQKVAQGEPLGLVDGSPATRQNVYFELRRQGDPIDPKPRKS